MKKRFKFKMDGEELVTPNTCQSATVRTGRDEEFIFQSCGMEIWAKENPKQFEELYNALLPKKKKRKKK